MRSLNIYFWTNVRGRGPYPLDSQTHNNSTQVKYQAGLILTSCLGTSQAALARCTSIFLGKKKRKSQVLGIKFLSSLVQSFTSGATIQPYALANDSATKKLTTTQMNKTNDIRYVVDDDDDDVNDDRMFSSRTVR